MEQSASKSSCRSSFPGSTARSTSSLGIHGSFHPFGLRLLAGNTTTLPRAATERPTSAGFTAAFGRCRAPSGLPIEDQQKDHISPGLLAWRHCVETPKVSSALLRRSVPFTASAAVLPFCCNSRGSMSSSSTPQGGTPLLAKASPTDSGAARNSCVEIPARQDPLCTAKFPVVRGAFKGVRKLKESSCGPQTCLRLPERTSEGSTTAGEWPLAEECKRGEDERESLMESKSLEEANQQKIAETAEKNAAKFATIMQEALQARRKKIVAVEMLQATTQETQELDDKQITRKLSHCHNRQAGFCSAVQEAQGPSQQRQKKRQLREELEQSSEHQEENKDEDLHLQRQERRKCGCELFCKAFDAVSSLYPFETLREITAERPQAFQEYNPSSAKCVQEELQRSAEALLQQQQAAERQDEQIRSLRAALAAAALQQEQQQLLLQRKLQQATVHAAKAEDEAAAAKGREKQLLLQLEEQRQRLAAAERHAAARSSQLSRQLQAAETREKELKKVLAVAQETLAFLSSLQQQLRGGDEQMLFAFNRRISGREKTVASPFSTRSIRSSSSSRSNSSKTICTATLPQDQQEMAEGRRKRQQKELPEKFCVLDIPAEIQQLMDSLDTEGYPTEAASFAGLPVTAAANAGRKGKQQGEETGSPTSPCSSSEGLPLGILSLPAEQPLKLSSNGDCCCSSCSKTTWELQQQLCNATAGLIVKTQLLAAGEARAQELQQQAADSEAAAKAAEEAVAAAEKKLLCVMSENTWLQAEAATFQQQQAAAKETEAGMQRLRRSERRLQLRCELLTKEKETWKKQLQQLLLQKQQLIQRLHQQELFLLGTQRAIKNSNQQQQQQQQQLTQSRRKLDSRCWSADADEHASRRATAASTAAAAAEKAEGPDALLSLLKHLANGFQQLNEDAAFLRRLRWESDVRGASCSSPRSYSLQQQRPEKRQREGNPGLLVCRWPEGHKAPTERDRRRRSSSEDGKSSSSKQLAEGLEGHLADTGNKLVAQTCAALLCLGRRLGDSQNEEDKRRKEVLLLRGLLQRERERFFRQHTEKAVLNAQLQALNSKLAVLEAFAASEEAQAAESQSLFSRQLQTTLRGLTQRESENSLLQARQVVLDNKIKKLQEALKGALVKARLKASAATAAAEDEVLQKLSGWRESLVKTTVEAAQSCCSNGSNRSKSNGNCCCSRERQEGSAAASPAFRGLARRHAAAELAIIELTEALSKTNLRLACLMQSSTAKSGLLKSKEGKDRLNADGHFPAEASELSGEAEAPGFCFVSRSIQQPPLEGRRELQRQRSLFKEEGNRMRRTTSCTSGCCCASCKASNSHRVKQLQQQQQQLFTAYVAQQQELQATTRTLVWTRAEASRLSDCLEGLEMEVVMLEEAAAKGEEAILERETLRDQVRHLQACLVRERKVWSREMHLLQAAPLHQPAGAPHRGVVEVIRAAHGEAAAARQKLQHKELEAKKLRQFALQLQTEAAEQAQTNNRLLQALALCSTLEERSLMPGHEWKNPRLSKLRELLKTQDSEAAKRLLALLLEFCIRLVSLERERLTSLLSSHLHEPLAPSPNLRSPKEAVDFEELLLAHRLLLGGLLYTQLHAHREITDIHQGKAVAPRLQPQEQQQCCCAESVAAASNASSSAAETTALACQPFPSLDVAVVAPLLEGGWNFLSLSAEAEKAQCSSCSASGAGSCATAAALGSHAPGEGRGTEFQAAHVLHHLRSLRGPLLFVVAAQQRLFTLLADRRILLFAPETAAAKATTAVTPRAFGAEAAAESLLLLRKLQDAAATAAETLKAAVALSASLYDSVAPTAQTATAKVCSPREAPGRNPQEGVLAVQANAAAAAAPDDCRVHCRGSGRGPDKTPSAVTLLRSSRCSHSRLSSAHKATASSTKAASALQAEAAAVPKVPLRRRAHGAAPRSQHGQARLTHASCRTLYASSAEAAPLAAQRTSKILRGPRTCRIRRSKSCVFGGARKPGAPPKCPTARPPARHGEVPCRWGEAHRAQSSQALHQQDSLNCPPASLPEAAHPAASVEQQQEQWRQQKLVGRLSSNVQRRAPSATEPAAPAAVQRREQASALAPAEANGGSTLWGSCLFGRVPRAECETQQRLPQASLQRGPAGSLQQQPQPHQHNADTMLSMGQKRYLNSQLPSAHAEQKRHQYQQQQQQLQQGQGPTRHRCHSQSGTSLCWRSTLEQQGGEIREAGPGCRTKVHRVFLRSSWAPAATQNHYKQQQQVRQHQHAVAPSTFAKVSDWSTPCGHVAACGCSRGLAATLKGSPFWQGSSCAVTALRDYDRLSGTQPSRYEASLRRLEQNAKAAAAKLKRQPFL